ncbi:MAG: hypothetical protein IPH56_14730 [Chitinophagaceae bacterium]|nr:hypothetical protein [Chitinophagaceae bacterium]
MEPGNEPGAYSPTDVFKKLETHFPADEIIERLKNIQVPMGILQIPVENALLHGLSNREEGPWKLTIAIAEIENYINVTITDNGVGRKIGYAE